MVEKKENFQAEITLNMYGGPEVTFLKLNVFCFLAFAFQLL